jgi:hypothetical protein
VLELPTQQTRRPAFHQLNQPVNAELRIDINKQMHVIFHNLDFRDDRLTLCRTSRPYLFQSLIGALFEHSYPSPCLKLTGCRRFRSLHAEKPRTAIG